MHVLNLRARRWARIRTLQEAFGGPELRQAGSGLRQAEPELQAGPGLRQARPELRQAGPGLRQAGPEFRQAGSDLRQAWLMWT